MTQHPCFSLQANLPKLFGQYVQFDADTLQGGKGSGLGLWLSKAIVEMHGGVIGATSEGEGKGCTFFLEMPCRVTPICNNNIAHKPVEKNIIKAKHRSVEWAAQDETTVVDLCVTAFDDVRHLEKLSMDIPELLSYRSGEDVPALVEMRTVYTKSKHYKALIQGVSDTPPTPMVVPQRYYRRHLSVVESHKEQSESITGLKVLLVDDSVLARKMVERMLTDAGFHCHHACNGLQAVEKVTAAQQAGEQPFDVVLMDCYMPVMNGPEAVQLIRGDQCGYKGVVLALTGSDADTSEFVPLLGTGGVDRIMVKPFQLPMFRSALFGMLLLHMCFV